MMSRISPGDRRGSATSGSPPTQPPVPPVPPSFQPGTSQTDWHQRVASQMGPMPGQLMQVPGGYPFDQGRLRNSGSLSPGPIPMQGVVTYPADQRRLSASNVVVISPTGIDSRRLSVTHLLPVNQPQPVVKAQRPPPPPHVPIQAITVVPQQQARPAPIEQPRSVQQQELGPPSPRHDLRAPPPEPVPRVFRAPSTEAVDDHVERSQPAPPTANAVLPSTRAAEHQVKRSQPAPPSANAVSSREVRVTELRPSGDPLLYRSHVKGQMGLPPPAPPVSSFKSMYHHEPQRPSNGLIRQVGIGMLVVKRFLSHWEPYQYNEHRQLRRTGPHGIEGQPSLQIAGLLASTSIGGLSASHSVSEYDEEGVHGTAQINRVYVPGGGAAVSTRAFQLFIEELLPDYGAKLSRQVEVGDEILAINDVPVTSVDEVKRMTIGDERSTCRLTIRRRGRAIDVAVVRVCPEKVANNYVHGQICTTRMAKTGVPLRPTVVAADNNTSLTHAMRDYPKDAKGGRQTILGERSESRDDETER